MHGINKTIEDRRELARPVKCSANKIMVYLI